MADNVPIVPGTAATSVVAALDIGAGVEAQRVVPMIRSGASAVDFSGSAPAFPVGGTVAIATMAMPTLAIGTLAFPAIGGTVSLAGGSANVLVGGTVSNAGGTVSVAAIPTLSIGTIAIPTLSIGTLAFPAIGGTVSLAGGSANALVGGTVSLAGGSAAVLAGGTVSNAGGSVNVALAAGATISLGSGGTVANVPPQLPLKATYQAGAQGGSVATVVASGLLLGLSAFANGTDGYLRINGGATTMVRKGALFALNPQGTYVNAKVEISGFIDYFAEYQSE